jgi:hypothetical protein
MTAPRAIGPALALAAGGLRSAHAAASASPLAWTLRAGAAACDLAADLVALGAGWTGPHARAVEGGLCDALAELPGVSDQEAQRIARGVSAAVSVVRRWCLP